MTNERLAHKQESVENIQSVQARTVPYLQVSSSSSFWDRWDGCSLGTFR